jgi:hypothetical protein
MPIGEVAICWQEIEGEFNSFPYQAGELSENSLISEIFVSTSEKIRQGFLLAAYAFRDFLIF